MHVNKYRIKLSDLRNGDNIELTLPISNENQNYGQHELVETKFVNIEVEKAINPITDFEQVRLKPVDNLDSPLNNLIRSVTYSINTRDENNKIINTTYADVGFIDTDIKFRKNAFLKSFLRLNFYNSDNVATQKLVSYAIIFPSIDSKFYLNSDNPRNAFFSGSAQKQWGMMTPVNQINLEFSVGDSMLDRTLIGEGYYLYYYKDELFLDSNTELFMTATFNNAKTGKTTRLITSDKDLGIDEIFTSTNGTIKKNNVHTKYLLKKDLTGYYYKIDTDYSSNVKIIGNNYEVNLYQIYAK